MTRSRVLALSLVALSIVGCSDDKKDYDSIAAAVDSPSGELRNGDDAKNVAVAFSQQIGGFRASHDGGIVGYTEGTINGTFQCLAGGQVTFDAHGNEEAASAEINYDSCCVAAGCCVDGHGEWYFKTDKSKSTFSKCGEWDVQGECGGFKGHSEFEGCVSYDGEWFVVKVNKADFAVSGHYENGSGEWTVKCANGTWECKANAGEGKCSNGTSEITWKI